MVRTADFESANERSSRSVPTQVLPGVVAGETAIFTSWFCRVRSPGPVLVSTCQSSNVTHSMKFKELKLLEVGHSMMLAGTVFIDNNKMYLCMFPDEHGDIKDIEGNDTVEVVMADGATVFAETLNMNIDEWNQFIRQTDLLETEILAKAADGKIAKAVVRKSQRQIDAHISWEVFKRDGYKCRYCGNDSVPLTVDHLVLWEEGGPSVKENLVSACKKCNRARGNTSYIAWLESPFYQRVSRNLYDFEKATNKNLAKTLDKIPKVVHTRSR